MTIEQQSAGSAEPAESAAATMTAESPATPDSAPATPAPAPLAKTAYAKAALQVFLGGASYGAMATTYKLSYAAGFTTWQVVAAQAWFGCALFAVAVLVSLARGKRWTRLPWKRAAKLLGLGLITSVTTILYTYAMSLLPVPVALTLLFQFTWIGLVIQVIWTRRPPTVPQVVAALVIVVGTVFASGVYETGIAGYDPVGLVCGFCSAISCALFVALSGKVDAGCSTEQRGFTVCLGTVVASLVVCPDFVVSGVLLEGIAPFGLVMGTFGLLLPVLLFGLGTPHLPSGTATILTSAELPAGLLVAMVVLGTPIGAVEWLGVAAILAGVCIAQIQPRSRARE